MKFEMVQKEKSTETITNINKAKRIECAKTLRSKFGVKRHSNK